MFCKTLNPILYYSTLPSLPFLSAPSLPSWRLHLLNPAWSLGKRCELHSGFRQSRQMPYRAFWVKNHALVTQSQQQNAYLCHNRNSKLTMGITDNLIKSWVSCCYGTSPSSNLGCRGTKTLQDRRLWSHVCQILVRKCLLTFLDHSGMEVVKTAEVQP